MADLKTNLLGFVMNSPVIGASGTVGYGVEYEELADFSKIGGISGKGLTLHGQYGNKGERLWETPSGLINSIGLQNPGVQHFIDVELPEMLELKQKYGTVAIANLGGHSEEEYVEGAAMLSDSAVDIVELNISCPNVKVGGIDYVADVMNNLDRTSEKNIFDGLSEHERDLADEIRKRMFVFEDIVTMDDRSVQRFVRDCDPRDLVLALKGANSDVANKIFTNMSARMAQSIREDLEITSNVRIRDVEEAQQRIVGIIRDLEERSELIILKGGKDDIIA